MPTRHALQSARPDIRRISPIEFHVLTEGIVRQARAAQAAAITGAVVQAFAAVARGVRWLSSALHETFTLRDTMMPARQRSVMLHPNHYQ